MKPCFARISQKSRKTSTFDIKLARRRYREAKAIENER